MLSQIESGLTIVSVSLFCLTLLGLITRVFPGPFWAKFSRLWYLGKAQKGDFQATNIKLHQKYGSIVRIAPNELSIDDPNALNTVYGHGTHFTKSPWYEASGQPNVSNLFTERNSRNHATLRRKVASLYSMTTLLAMESCVEECTRIMIKRMEEFSENRKVFNMQHWLQCYAFDLIGLITVAKRFGFLDAGKDLHGLFPSLESYLRYSVNIGIYNETHPLLHKLIRYLGQGSSHLLSFTEEQIKNRAEVLNDAEKRPGLDDDFLAKTLQKHQDDPQNFTMQDVTVTCLTNIGAGSDTTSISLCAIMWYLLRNPTKYSKLQEEIDTMADISLPVTFKDAQKMPYLQAVIKEALRLHPATGLPLGRVVPKGGAVIANAYIPEGTVVGINTWVAHHNTDVFGPDAAAFRPERWLKSEEESKRMEKYYIPFGHGSRTCVGKNISLMEISVLIPELVRRFNFTLADPDSELKSENVWFVKQKNVLCQVSKRQ
ncbi:cytochrome P450 [Corynespora cassiicola Philippines]|uniref:Cytochrome P450 n=1 Tax=Corynespora cassiicola Philippines TaxID=1448308 RepID=A0A2T2NAU9_CORCC|nr:cytochrome P450 [Corynespora cassiicola Philippines]